MKRMLLVALAAASVTLSAGAAMADVVCAPGCGLATPAEAQNLKQNAGKTNAGTHISSQGAAHNNAGITQPPSGGGGPVVLF